MDKRAKELNQEVENLKQNFKLIFDQKQKKVEVSEAAS